MFTCECLDVRIIYGLILTSGRSNGAAPLPDETRKVSQRGDAFMIMVQTACTRLILHPFTLTPGPNLRGGGLKKNSMNE